MAEVSCFNKGCGKKFDPANNNDEGNKIHSVFGKIRFEKKCFRLDLISGNFDKITCKIINDISGFRVFLPQIQFIFNFPFESNPKLNKF